MSSRICLLFLQIQFKRSLVKKMGRYQTFKLSVDLLENNIPCDSINHLDD